MTPRQLHAFVARDHEQERDWSCGAAALVTAALSLGREITESQARELTDTSWDGVDEDQLKTAILTLGFRPEVLHSSDRDGAWNRLVDFLRRGIPCLLCVDEWEHWVTAVGVNRDRVVVVDPEDVGKTELSRGELLARWENPKEDRTFYAIAVRP
jgi:ABC-type bacteriocin/lantibiotic exporter with double-glycine peptidase domain